jgi:hypothetical protein
MKKLGILFLSILSFVSLFGTNTAQTSAAEKLTKEEQTFYNSMTKEEQKEYNKIKKLAPKTQLTEDQQKQFDKFVGFKDNKYYIIDSKELKGQDKKIIKEYLDYSNYAIKDIDYSNTNITKSDKSIEIKIPSKTRGYGQRFVNWYWWGGQIGLTRDDLSAVCYTVVGIVSGLIALIPGIGWSIAAIIGGGISALGVCHFWISSGIVFQINNGWYGPYISKIWWQ